MKNQYKLLTSLVTLGIFALATPAFAGAVLKGTVKYGDAQPKLKKLDMMADPVCMGLHSAVTRSETVLVNPNGTLKNVFVYVKEGLEGQSFETPAEKVVFDQKGCMYDPHVLGVQVGQPIEMLNSDDTLHNVHALAKENKEFNYGMPFKGMALPAQFDTEEIMVKMKCDVHPWMKAYIGVVAHPHFSVTDDEGVFDLGELPDGEYTIEAWHEHYGTQMQKVTLPGEAVIFDFTPNKATS
jgi:plastocyanin